MKLLNKLKFSQVNLQDYVDCKRRFYYRYVQNLSWPALETEPALEREQRMLQGALFHKLVQQYYLGLPKELLSKQAQEDPVNIWWTNFLASSPAKSAKKKYPEQILKIYLSDYQVIAKYDLVAINDDKTVDIYDWKTSLNKPKREYIATRLQTRVYPFVLANAIEVLIEGKKTNHENIELVYWYANYPDSTEKFTYSGEKMKSDRDYLLKIINEIVSLETMENFPLTPDVDHCRFCVYRSLCDRGDVAGDINFFTAEFDINEDLDLDFDLVEEVEF